MKISKVFCAFLSAVIVVGAQPWTPQKAQAANTGYSASISVDEYYSLPRAAKATYKILNNNTTEKEVRLILAAIDNDNTLLSVESTTVTAKVAQQGEYTLKTPIEDKYIDEGITARAFAWEDKTCMPIAEAQTKVGMFEDAVNALSKGSEFTGFDVKLTGDSYFKKQLFIGANYLNYYDADRLSASLFAKNKSDKSPAQIYGGWEGGGLPGHSVGHYLSACVSMYMQTGNEDFKKRAERIIYLMGEAQYDDGYLGGAAKSKMDYVFNNPDTFTAGGHNDAFLNGVWGPWYSIHKVYAGLIDAYLYLNNEDALQIAMRMADYAKRGTDKLSDARMDYMLNGEYGGLNESFAQLYEITGNRDYLILAQRFSHKKVMDPLSRGEDNLSGLHANTQIPKMVGAAKIYQLTGSTYYKNVAENFWKYVVYDRSYATGGNCDKEFFTDRGTEPRSVDSTETCNVYNMLKLTEYLYSMNPKTEYIEYYENALYNHILGSQNPVGDKTYNIDLTMGGNKLYRTHVKDFSCCEGTGMENPGRFYRMIYFKGKDDLRVNLFIDSALDWKEKGVKLQQTTAFPYSDTTLLTFEETRGEELPVMIRIPAWAKGAKAEVNGKSVAVENLTDGYLALKRSWAKGDTIKLTFPMDYSLYVSREDKEGKIVSFKYGPILLAGEQTTQTVPYIVTDTRSSAQIVSATDKSKLRFEIKNILQPGAASMTLKPFFEFVSERYNVYWNLYTPSQYSSTVVQDTFDKRLSSTTYDVVYPNNSASETAHNLQTVGKSSAGTYNSKGWRDAVGDSSFSYDLTIKPTSVNYLLTLFYGKEWSNANTRTFDILADGVLLETYTLNKNRPNDAWEYHYIELPSTVTDGKSKITITYRANAAGYQAGGVFEVRTTGAELLPY